MINKKLILSLLTFILFLTWFFVNKTNSYTGYPDSSSALSTPSHPSLFFDEITFNEGITKTKKENKFSDYHISGGIVPHHLLPGFILTDFFNRLSVQNPKTIILIGPNHYEKGNFKALTSLYSWDTPFGRVEPDSKNLNRLIKKGVLKVDEEVLPNDHSAAGIMPFIKYYLPDTKVIPILISALITRKDSEVLAENLKEIMGEDVVLVAAVDFSHYLNNEQAKEKDEETLKVLKNYDYRQLFAFENDNIDSPPSIAILLMTMQKLETTKMDVLYHTNSGEIQNSDYTETTSYFSIAYY